MTRRVLLGCSATFAGAFDFGFMTLAAPALDRDLGLGAAYPWIFSAGSLAYGASVMPAAALAARPQRALAAGLTLAAVGIAVVAAAPDGPAALIGRVLFGLGGGVAAAPALALLAGIEPPAARRAAFARLGGAVAAGFTTGVVLAAAVVPAAGWRTVLLAFAVLLAALGALARRAAAVAPRGAASTGGAWWFAGATAGLSAALALAGPAPLLAAIAFAVTAGLARRGWRRAGAWLAPARAATFAFGAAGAATTASGVGATVLLGRTLEERGADGLVLGAFGLAVPPAIALARRRTQRSGASGAVAAGLALQSAGIAALAVAVDRADPLALALPLVAFGAGHVVANAGTADAVTALAGAHAAPAGGLLVTAQFAGGGAGALLVLAAGGPAAGLALAAAIAAAGAVPALLSRRAGCRSAPASADPARAGVARHAR